MAWSPVFDTGPVVARASSEAVAAHLSGIAEKIVDVVDLPCVGGDSTASLASEAMGVQVQGRQADGADGRLVRQWAALDVLHPR
jgi:hypothetical protein